MARILIIDDYPSVLLTLEYFLSEAGHEVVSTTDGAAGLNLAAAERIDLVLTDIDMPRMSGWEVCEAMRRDVRLCDLPVVMMTGRSLSENVSRARAVGAQALVAKPFERAEILNEIALQLRKPGTP